MIKYSTGGANFMSDEKKEKKIIQNLSTISHEIQTPVNLIFSTAKLLCLKYDDNPEIIEFMDNIINNCQRIAMLVGNIMGINLVTVSKKEYLNTKQFFDAFCNNVKPYCDNEKVELKCEFKIEKEYVHIPVDTTERILLNLITNAIKYNDKKVKKIRIKMTNDVNNVIFSVKDNGMGIAEQNIEKITEQFYRVDNNISKGNGLGLALIKEYLNSMGGNMTIKSQLKKGTEFIVSIPSTPENMIFESRESDYVYTPEKSTFDIEFAQFKNNFII